MPMYSMGELTPGASPRSNLRVDCWTWGRICKTIVACVDAAALCKCSFVCRTLCMLSLQDCFLDMGMIVGMRQDILNIDKEWHHVLC